MHRPAGKVGGFTLIEVVVSIMLSAIIVSAMMAMAMTVRGSGGKGERRLIGGQASKALSDILKNYVTADPTAADPSGPNADNSGNRWSINGLYGTVVDDRGDVYALEPGTHTLSGFMSQMAPPWFVEAPYNGRISYYVATGTGDSRWINIMVNWDEP
ncbi:MAG: type II secretion system protein [Elusimicrobia bacterium]|nr:type II secretion system protein [Elusimicrobiota bacterium]